MDNIQNQPTSLRNIFIYSGIAVAFVVVGIFIGVQFFNVEPDRRSDEVVPPATQSIPGESVQKIYKVAGVVESISGSKISFKSETDQTAVLVATVTSATVIEKFVQKNQPEIKKETDAYLKSIEGRQFTTEPPVLPAPFVKNQIPLKEVKVGDYIRVVSAEDISGLKEFTAASIEVHMLPTINKPTI